MISVHPGKPHLCNKLYFSLRQKTVITLQPKYPFVLDYYKFHHAGATICIAIGVSLVGWIVMTLLDASTSDGTGWDAICGVGLFALIIITAGAWHFYRAWELAHRRESLLAHGIRIHTQFLNLNGGSRRGAPKGYSRRFIETAVGNIDAVQGKVFRSDPFWLPSDFRTDTFAPGRAIDVFCDSNNPTRYWMDLRFL